MCIVFFNIIAIMYFLGLIDSKTFSLIPKLEILNLMNCNIQKVADNSFGNLNNLKSLDVRESTFPIDTNTFINCKLKSIYLSDLEIDLEKLSTLKFLEEITFTNCTFSVISKAAFSDFGLLKSITFSSCKINKINFDAFHDLGHLTELRITECILEFLDTNCFSNLISLKNLSFHANAINSDINYEVFQNLPSLETILFDLEIYKNLDFQKYCNLKTVEIGYNDETDEELRNSIISMLTDKKLHYELVFIGKVVVDMNEVQICA